MQALELQQLGHIALVERPIPLIGPGEVLIRTLATTLCTSDLIDVRENPFGGPIPRILGHEAAGIVVDVGVGVNCFLLGQLVASHPVISCGKCEECLRRLAHLCSNMQHLGVYQDGTFAEYFRTRADRVVALPENCDPCVAALLEPVAVCLHAIVRGRIVTGDRVLIVGDGPFGILISRLATRLGAVVSIVGRHTFRLKHAAAEQSILALGTGDSDKQVCDRNTGGEFDVAILCAGTDSAFKVAFQSLRARGRLVVFSPLGAPAQIDLFETHVRELEIIGACNDRQSLQVVAELLTKRELALEQLITHRVPLKDFEKAFRLASRSKDTAIKVAFVMGRAA